MWWWLLALILVGVVVPITILNRKSFQPVPDRGGFAQAAAGFGEGFERGTARAGP